MIQNFNDLMRTPEPKPNSQPDIGRGPDAAGAWLAAISGKSPAKPVGLADTQAAANSWLSQPFLGAQK